jgi:hypothetical protein
MPAGKHEVWPVCGRAGIRNDPSGLDAVYCLTGKVPHWRSLARDSKNPGPVREQSAAHARLACLAVRVAPGGWSGVRDEFCSGNLSWRITLSSDL